MRWLIMLAILLLPAPLLAGCPTFDKAGRDRLLEVRWTDADSQCLGGESGVESEFAADRTDFCQTAAASCSKRCPMVKPGGNPKDELAMEAVRERCLARCQSMEDRCIASK